MCYLYFVTPFNKTNIEGKAIGRSTDGEPVEPIHPDHQAAYETVELTRYYLNQYYALGTIDSILEEVESLEELIDELETEAQAF